MPQPSSANRSSPPGQKLASVSKLLLPARVDLIRVLLERQERALDFFMSLRILDDTIRQADVTIGASLPQLPRLLALAARCSALLGAILVPERAAASSQDDIGVAQVLEEGWQPQGVHAARDDRRSLLHALPLLVIVRAISLVVLQHVCDALVRSIALHLAEAHGADVDAAGADDPRELRVHEGCVAALGLRACHGTLPGAVVVQELLREDSAGHCNSSTARNISIDQEGRVLAQRPELRQHILAPCNHLIWVIC